MKKTILLLLFCGAPWFTFASHIVGGEFELLHISGFSYKLNMVLYFDEINGQQNAKDPSVTVRIFRLSDNAIVRDVIIPLISTSLVSYTQPSCSNGALKTSRMLYSTTITLSSTTFNDPGGYYIAWERCCRNYSITNIYSQVPGAGITAGQTFYLEFPPVVKDGQPFVDSTPRLFPPLSDYACPRRPYYTNFGGTDDDGDSLVYSLATPLSTTGDQPSNLPRPYPEVTWRSPFGLTNIVGGAPDLKISTDGFLTVTPTSQGLYVFAVKVQEFRNKVKIGETRRDFQMLVVDACPRAVPPNVLGKKLTDATYTYDNNMSASFTNSVPDGQRCIKVQVTDDDSKMADDNFIEKITIKAIPLNFKKDLSAILPVVTNATLVNGSAVEFTICFPQCPYFVGGDPVIGIVAMDDACSLPLTDTLKITLHVEPPPNSPPYFTSTNPVNSPLGTLKEGQSGAWPFAVKDDDNDPLIVSVLTNGFVLADAGMTFNIFNQINGAADGQIAWDAKCDIYNFAKRTNFIVTVQVEDQDLCNIPNPKKALYNLNVILPGNADPIIDTDLTPDPLERSVTGLTRKIYDTFKFSVTGKDLVDNDYLVMKGTGKDFNFSDYGITYTPNPVNGNGLVSASFQWNLSCTSVDLKKKDTFDFQFIVVDNANKCRIYKADTVDIEVKILPPVNQPPILTVTNKGTASILNNHTISMIRGQAIDFVLTGTDADVAPSQDNLKLSIAKATGSVKPDGYSFTAASGKSPIQSEFTWQPDCSIFELGIYENTYDLTFMIGDDHCLTAKKDSVIMHITIKDVDGSDALFVPPNFFSPNGDNLNDYFAMEMVDNVTGERKNILPNDNCISVFEGIHIYNRWGETVFDSRERDFKWYGLNQSPGVYYYLIKYSKKEYKGTVSLRY